MPKLEQLTKEFQESVIYTQLEILQNCARGKKEYKFTEDNFPPIYRTTYISPVNGDPFTPHSESAPHWRPSLKRLASWMLKKVRSGEINLPLQKDRTLQKRVVVPDRNGMIAVELYISDEGINYEYKYYTIIDTLAPFLRGIKRLGQIEPFYVCKDKRIN